jgi:hypothetical protein
MPPSMILRVASVAVVVVGVAAVVRSFRTA